MTDGTQSPKRENPDPLVGKSGTGENAGQVPQKTDAEQRSGMSSLLSPETRTCADVVQVLGTFSRASRATTSQVLSR